MEDEFIAPSRPIELISGKEVFRYDSINALSSSLSVGLSKLIGHIRRGRGDVHGMRLEFRLVQETVEERIRREIADAERLEKQKYNNPMKVPPKPIEVTFADGTTREYKSKGECVTDLGVSHDGINRAINKRGGHMPKKGLRFRYLDEE